MMENGRQKRGIPEGLWIQCPQCKASLFHKEIADRLYLSGGTVRNYLSAVISKTGARNRLDAIRIARKDGWLH